MNNNCLLKSKVIYSVLLLVCTVIFFSCDNFLQGGEVKEAIDKAIYIANSECPVATLEEPTFQDSGLAKNRAIIITFTKSINPETFNPNFKIEDTKGNDLKGYFLKPEWSNDNKTVRIPANELKLIDLGTQSTMDILVKLTRACTTPDNLPITSAINHKYRINNDIDNTPPEIISIRAEVPALYISRKEEEPARILKEGNIPDIQQNQPATEEQTKAENAILSVNHINTKFDIYIEGSDYGGGEVWGHIKYHQLYDSMGETVSADEEEFYFDFEKNEDNDNYHGKFTIDLSDNEQYSDGLYEVKVTIQDAYYMDSTEIKTFNVVRDTIFAYSSKTRFGLSSPLFRDDFSDTVSEDEKAVAIAEYWYDPNVMPPTATKIEDSINEISFSYLPNDAYYRSKLTNTTYCDISTDYAYYISWGVNINELSEPIELLPFDWAKDNFNDDEFKGPILEKFKNFAKDNKNSNIIMQAKILDAVGNDNYTKILYPKQIDFHNYIVSDDENNSGKKKVELYFEDMTKSDFTKIANLPDRKIKAIYRVYYSVNPVTDEDESKEAILKRNTAVPLEQDHWSDISDLHTINNLEPDSTYVAYVQVEYKTDSMLNGQWVGETFGPLYKIIIDTSIDDNVNLEAPLFTFDKKSAGINTGLFDVTVNISNFDENVKYVPCYSTDGGNSWIYYESSQKNTFTFKVTNPLRAPFESLWNKPEWDLTAWVDNEGNYHDNGDNTYFESVKICTEKFKYPGVSAKIKLLAVYNTNTVANTIESEVQEIKFEESDDNIPPFVTSNVTQHDSRLSYDGRYYQFENIVREDEGHLSEYFNYYYTPYQESWGDNLSIMEPEDIENLPGGTATYTSSCYIDKNTACYTIDAAIPVYGLEDGRYMFFAKVTDIYGNYDYITLGKADIGTFKNKLTVTYDTKKNMLISTLPIEGDEHFDRNMIHVQDCWHDDETKKETLWCSDGYFGYLNQLQNCEKTNENGKTILQNDNSKATVGDFIYINWDVDPAIVEPTTPKVLRGNCFYRITMQGFNENPYNESKRRGVDRKYGRPYSKFDPTQTNPNETEYLYTDKLLGYIEGETEYDLCTEETVSNTVYYYIPTTDAYGNVDETTFDKDYLNDIKSSFFADTATPRSNKAYLVNVIASGRDLGNDADEWERRGKLIKSHLYYPWRTQGEFDNFNTFDSSVAANDMYESHEKGLVYYVAVVHFADGSTALSNVYTMQGF